MRIGITGISGSLGSALARYLARLGRVVVGISRDELRAERIMAAHNGLTGNVRVVVVAAGLADVDAIAKAFRGCDVIVHAAALKRISGSVYAHEELVKTNILGTMNMLEVARRITCRKFLLVSSDKAVEATNLYGSTKFTAECLAVQENTFSYPAGMRIAAARYGNVLGSRGSVAHIWRKRVALGLPLQLTDPAMTRFCITMDHAVQLVVKSLEDMRGGEIFVPILPSMNMADLAGAITRDDTYPIEITGLRPGGEKMHEILLSQEEPYRTHAWEIGGMSCYMILPSHRSWSRDAYPGVPVPTTLTYCSAANSVVLSQEELQAALRDVPDMDPLGDVVRY